MSDKRQELKTLRGLNALDPGPRPPEVFEPAEAAHSPSNGSQKTSTLSEVFAAIQERMQKESSQALVYREFTSLAGEPKSAFKRGQVIEFNLEVAASGLLSDLKAPFTLELIAFDLRTQHAQPLYSFKKQGRLEGEIFIVSFQAQAALAGSFRLQSLLTVDGTEHFSVSAGAHFLVV